MGVEGGGGGMKKGKEGERVGRGCGVYCASLITEKEMGMEMEKKKKGGRGRNGAGKKKE